MKLWQILLLYWLLMCLISYIQFYLDKKRAREGRWRIPEKTLFLTAGLGGAAGALLAMRRFRHNTHHKRFTVGIPLLLMLHLGVVALIVWLYVR